MLGGLMRGYTGDVLNSLVPTLTGVVNTEVYSSGIYEKMFIAAFCAQQIESLGGFDALDAAGARYFQNFPGAGYPLIPILNPGLTAPGAAGPMWGPNAPNVIGNDIAATQWLYRGGAIPNAPAALPLDLSPCRTLMMKTPRTPHEVAMECLRAHKIKDSEAIGFRV